MTERITYSPKEFAKIFGRDQSWSYRLISEERISVISQFGNKMIPVSEVDRILNSADSSYTKPKQGRGRPCTKPQAPINTQDAKKQAPAMMPPPKKNHTDTSSKKENAYTQKKKMIFRGKATSRESIFNQFTKRKKNS